MGRPCAARLRLNIEVNLTCEWWVIRGGFLDTSACITRCPRCAVCVSPCATTMRVTAAEFFNDEPTERVSAARTEVGRVRHRQIFLEACPARSWAVACELNLVMASAQPSLANFGIVLTGRLGLRNDLLSTFSVGKDVWEECGPATHSHEPMSQAQDRGVRMRVLRGYAWTAPALERETLTERAPPSSSQALLRAYAQGASLLRPQARCWRPP